MPCVVAPYSLDDPDHFLFGVFVGLVIGTSVLVLGVSSPLCMLKDFWVTYVEIKFLAWSIFWKFAHGKSTYDPWISQVLINAHLDF